MTHEECLALVRLVKAMRAAQVGYFRCRDRASLRESERLEREVDTAIAKMEQKHRQGTLL